VRDYGAPRRSDGGACRTEVRDQRPEIRDGTCCPSALLKECGFGANINIELRIARSTFAGKTRLNLQVVLLVAVVRDNVVPFVGGGAGDKGHDRFGVAHVEDLVRHAGFNVNEIAGFVL